MFVDIRSVQVSLRDSGGVVFLQPDYYGPGPLESDTGDKATGYNYPTASPFGFISRPRDPSGNDPNSLVACEAIVIENDDGEGRVLPTTDPRYISVVPDPGKGGSIVYAVTDDGTHQDATTLMLAGDGLMGVTMGSVFLRVPYAEGAKAHMITVDLNLNTITITHGDGPAIQLATTGITISGSPATNLVGSGGAPVMTDSGQVAAAWAQIQTLFAGLSLTFTPPTGYTSTTVKA